MFPHTETQAHSRVFQSPREREGELLKVLEHQRSDRDGKCTQHVHSQLTAGPRHMDPPRRTGPGECRPHVAREQGAGSAWQTSLMTSTASLLLAPGLPSQQVTALTSPEKETLAHYHPKFLRKKIGLAQLEPETHCGSSSLRQDRVS